jgi:uncharacterized protein YxeA
MYSYTRRNFQPCANYFRSFFCFSGIKQFKIHGYFWLTETDSTPANYFNSDIMVWQTLLQKMKTIIITLLALVAAITAQTPLITYQDTALLFQTGSISKYSLSTHTLQGSITTDTAVPALYAYSYAFNSDYSKLYYVDGSSLRQLDLSDGSSIALSNGNLILGVVTSQTSVYELVSIFDSNNVGTYVLYKHDFSDITGTPTQYPLTNPGLSLFVNAIDLVNNVIYFADYINNKIVIFDMAAGSFSSVIAVDASFTKIIPTADGFAALTDDYNYNVYTRQGETITRVSSLALSTLHSANNLAVDSTNGKVYYFSYVGYQGATGPGPQTISDQETDIINIDATSGAAQNGFPQTLPHGAFTNAYITFNGAHYFAISNNIAVYAQLSDSNIAGLSFYNTLTQEYTQVSVGSSSPAPSSTASPSTSSPSSTSAPSTSSPSSTSAPSTASPSTSAPTICSGSKRRNCVPDTTEPSAPVTTTAPTVPAETTAGPVSENQSGDNNSKLASSAVQNMFAGAAVIVAIIAMCM